MERIKLIANELDRECAAVARGLQALGVRYDIVFTRDHPECVTAYGITRLPCLLIGEHVVYRGPLAESDLRLIFSAFQSTAAERARTRPSRRPAAPLSAGGAS